MNYIKELLGKLLSKDEHYIVSIGYDRSESKISLSQLTPKELDYLKVNTNLASELFKDFGLKISGHIFDSNRVTEGIKIWYDQNLENLMDFDVNIYSNSLASAWGNYLLERYNMQWYALTDNGLTEIGLYHEKNSVIIYPFQLVAKSFNNKDWHLLFQVETGIKELIKLQ